MPTLHKSLEERKVEQNHPDIGNEKKCTYRPGNTNW